MKYLNIEGHLPNTPQTKMDKGGGNVKMTINAKN